MAKKSLGQNFLVDSNIVRKIVNEVDATDNDLIIEIGPGQGALTKELKKTGAFLIAYEVDRDLVTYLNKLEDNKTKIIYKNFLESNIKDDIKDIKYDNLYLVGNLPYYITTPIIQHIIDEKIEFKKFTLMVQKEVADRFMAKEKTKDYGYFTLVLKRYFNISKVTNVSPKCFKPVPKVESTVLSFEVKNNIEPLDEEKYLEFLKLCFAKKRKTLKNNLSMYNWDKIKEVLLEYNLSELVRAEELSEEVLIKIFKAIV